MGRRSAFLALVTAAILWPASAWAATGQLSGSTMVYTAAAGESNSVVVTLDSANAAYLVQDAAAVSVTAVAPCQPGPNPSSMECPQSLVTDFSASLGDGSDSITVQAQLTTSIGGGAGDDVMSGGPLADNLRGGDQSDRIDGNTGDDTITGDAGADTVTGGDGNDALQGGADNDLLRADNGSDVLNGGDGVDTADYSARTAPQQLSLDGAANDGQDTFTDNVEPDIENVLGGSGGDTITGSDAPNQLDGNAGDDRIDGAAGDDVLDGGAGADAESGGDGADSLDGGADDDSLDGGAGGDVMAGGDGVDLGDYAARTAGVSVTLDGVADDGQLGEADNVEPDVESLRGGSGDDSFYGSAAANSLDGGAGEDYSDGGAGSDTLAGGDSGDVLRTRGSTDPDTVSCGGGPDFVVAKPADNVSPDCDRVDRGVRQKPKLRDSAVVTPATGALQMSPAGIVRRVPLLDRLVLPLRSVVDTTAGSARVTSSASRHQTQTVALEDGTFDITQSAGKRPITQLALQGGDFSVCPPAATGRTASSAARKTVRILWAKGKGKFRTKGRYAAAAIRGTRWETIDRCDGTQIKVVQGAVTVRDRVKRKTVVVRAGHSYLAKAVR